MSNRNKKFSVIVASHNRAEHILPTLRSALSQTYPDFEVIVVGDGPDDKTAAVVGGFNDPRLSWCCLPKRQFSQAFCNNYGIEKATGGRIAYLGHDDIWQCDHLAALAEIYEAWGADFVTSGCVFHQRTKDQSPFITGIFDNQKGPEEHFFPPTSFSHTSSFFHRIGKWKDPRKLSLPTDQDLVLRFQELGAKLCSTGKITTHKFPACDRYLDFLMPVSDEQTDLLAALDEGCAEQLNAKWIRDSKAASRFMKIGFQNPKDYEPGQLFSRGLKIRAATQSTDKLAQGEAVLVQGDYAGCGADWSPLGPSQLRFALNTTNPRILLPFSANGLISVWITVSTQTTDAAAEVTVRLNGHDTKKRVQDVGSGPLGQVSIWCITGPALDDAPSIIELSLPEELTQKGPSFFAIGPVAIAARPNAHPPVSYRDAVTRFSATTFPEAAYLAANEDVNRAIEASIFPNGLTHFLAYGRHENRPFQFTAPTEEKG